MSEIINHEDIPKELTGIKKLVMSKAAIEAYELKRKEVIDLFETQQKERIARQEEFFCQQILANSKDFSPQWDIGYLKDLQKKQLICLGTTFQASKSNN
jgi:uncharacterized membrane protein